MPEPKAVVAVGACACTGGVFKECYNVLGGIDKVLPVDVYVPGCCPRPEAIMDGIIAAAGKLDEKAKIMKQNKKLGIYDNEHESEFLDVNRQTNSADDLASKEENV
jgi:NADH:ubiquinone oxidoreductase subunit B-like Fe-S oxidoreductase